MEQKRRQNELDERTLTVKTAILATLKLSEQFGSKKNGLHDKKQNRNTIRKQEIADIKTFIENLYQFGFIVFLIIYDQNIILNNKQ